VEKRGVLLFATGLKVPWQGSQGNRTYCHTLLLLAEQLFDALDCCCCCAGNDIDGCAVWVAIVAHL
jgi:hypothetical protein